MRTIFMGTPDFAAAILKALVGSGTDIILVVTQPDREKGRGKSMAVSEVKSCALEYSLPVFQPEKIKDKEAVERIRELEPDIIVVAAFGQILSKELLELPKYGCINMHASLLPKYRGASPIQQAIIDGEKITGVTAMQMDEGLDTGDILFQEEIPIAGDETGGSLFDKLSVLAAQSAVKALRLIEQGEVHGIPQDNTRSCYAGMIKKEMGKLDFSGKTAAECERLIRALNPWPSAYTYINGRMLKLWSARVEKSDHDGQAGTITNVTDSSFSIRCREGELVIEELQLEGKKRMSVHDFLLGYKLRKGDVLG